MGERSKGQTNARTKTHQGKLSRKFKTMKIPHITVNAGTTLLVKISREDGIKPMTSKQTNTRKGSVLVNFIKRNVRGTPEAGAHVTLHQSKRRRGSADE